MNKLAKIFTEPPADYPDYSKDAYGWAMAQGRLLRERRFDYIDWDNVAEEIETMGRSERNVYRSHLIQLLIHILKWDAQPTHRGRSWYNSIINHRDDALQALAENPSLKPELDDVFAGALTKARRLAAQECNLAQGIFNAIDLSPADAFERTFDRPESD
jgi:Domain of unknown function DUF29